MPSSDSLLQPFTLKRVTIKNRIVSTSHAPAYADDGKPKERYQLYHEEKARGGIGMTMFGGSSCVAPDSPPVFGQLYVGDDSIIPHFQQFAERIHAYDCRLLCQLSHLGRRTTWNSGDWLPVMAPSRVREPAHRGFPKVMDKHDIRRAVVAYAQAAVRCKEGQLDGCELLSHGHLLEQFLSPATNRRSDAYGGSLANRLRFTLEVLEAVREAVGDDFIVGIRLVAKEDFEGGLTLDEGIAAAQHIERSGLVDYLNVNFGHIDSDHALAHHIPAMWSRLAPWLHVVADFRREVNLPLVHACRIADLASARYAINENIVDLVAMTRAHIADPHIVNKLVNGEEDLIRPCVGAGYCVDRIYEAGEALCLHNPATGREASMPHRITKADARARKAVVVGGGPAGLEAARVLRERGHHVVLFEAGAQLGGQITIAARANWRRDLIGIVDWYQVQLERLRVDIRWNTLAEADDVLGEAPDMVIVATGGVPDTDLVPGGELCMSTWDVLSGAEISGSVLVYDDNGQHQGPSCADFLSDKPDVNVEMVTPDRAVAMEMGSLNFPIFLQHFYAQGVSMTPDHRLTSVRRENNRLCAEFSNEFGQRGIRRVVDHVVVEHGTLPADALYWDLRDGSTNDGVTDYAALLEGRPQAGDGDGAYLLFRVGDAVASRNIHAAIYDSLRLCKDL